MHKHCHEHFAKEYKCEECEYTGTLLKLKSHKKQHDTTYYLNAYCEMNSSSIEWLYGGITKDASGVAAPNIKMHLNCEWSQNYN